MRRGAGHTRCESGCAITNAVAQGPNFVVCTQVYTMSCYRPHAMRSFLSHTLPSHARNVFYPDQSLLTGNHFSIRTRRTNEIDRYRLATEHLSRNTDHPQQTADYRERDTFEARAAISTLNGSLVDTHTHSRRTCSREHSREIYNRPTQSKLAHD